MALDNEEKYARAQYLILSSLERKPMRFNELERSAGVSSRTLTKHLRVLVPRMVQKVGNTHKLTEHGEDNVTNLRNHFDGSKRKASVRGYPFERLDVDVIHDEYHCHGVFTGFGQSRLELGQRAAVDNAMTQFIKNLDQSVPTGSDWKVSIVWRNRRQPLLLDRIAELEAISA